MFRQSLIALTIAGVAGCSASTSIRPVATGTGATRTDEAAQLAAYAATSRFPENANLRNDLQVGAIVDRDKGTIQIYNFTDRPLAPGNIWINRTYVQRSDAIPAHGKIALPRAKFYDRNGQVLSGTSAPAESVQLQWDNDVYSLLGPVYQ